MAINPSQYLNPQSWINSAQGAINQDNNFGDIHYDPLQQALTRMGNNTNLSEMPPGGVPSQPALSDQLQQPTPTTANKQYFSGVPVPLSPNNPYLAYLPKPGKGMIVTKKFIEDAVNWENQEQTKQDVETNRGRMSGVVLRALSEAAGNPEVMSGNRDILNFYGGLTDLIKLPGGENVAENILKEIRGMYGSAPTDPLAQLKAEELQSRINKTRKETSLLGLKESGDDREKRLKFYNDAYDRYLKVNGAKWNQNANLGEGDWEFPSGFQPLPQVDFIRQTFPNGEGAANEYIEMLTGMPVPKQATPGKKSKKPIYRPNTNYDIDVWNDAEVLSNTYGGPGKTLIFLATQKGAKPTDLIFKALVDRYNQNNKSTSGYVPYTAQRFYEAFILKK